MTNRARILGAAGLGGELVQLAGCGEEVERPATTHGSKGPDAVADIYSAAGRHSDRHDGANSTLYAKADSISNGEASVPSDRASHLDYIYSRVG